MVATCCGVPFAVNDPGWYAGHRTAVGHLASPHPERHRTEGSGLVLAESHGIEAASLPGMTNGGDAGEAEGGRGRAEASLAVLLAEDDDEFRSMIAASLRRDGHQVFEARDGSDLQADLACAYLAGSESADTPLVVTDLRLPVADSLTVIRQFHKHGWHPDFILMTAFGDLATHLEAAQLGALAVLAKPFEVRELREAVVRFARSRVTV
jgi:CheY-like chemotaxis protein